MDEVRFNIGDTDATDPQLTNEEIAFLLDRNDDNTLCASISAIQNIMAKFSRLCDETTGRVRVAFDQRFAHYKTMYDELKKRLSETSDLDVYSGGISISDKDTLREDTDAVQPAFQIDQFDEPNDAEDELEG